ncbi:MAG: hypothetical protein KKC51_00245 [Verrucomicrobia bacterium]|nr:hypothetical protein [Verrucomicrobiota bacterium]MBU1978574.1 hypothetical protein [Gammaproteobacteria bacterium]
MRNKFCLLFAAFVVFASHSVPAGIVASNAFASGISLTLEVPSSVPLGSNVTFLALIRNESTNTVTCEIGLGCTAVSFGGAGSPLGRVSSLLATNDLAPGATGIVQLVVSPDDYSVWSGMTRTLAMGAVFHSITTSDRWSHHILVGLTPATNILSLSASSIPQGGTVTGTVTFVNPYGVPLSNLVVKLTSGALFSPDGSYVEHTFTVPFLGSHESVSVSTNFTASQVGEEFISMAISGDRISGVWDDKRVIITSP